MIYKKGRVALVGGFSCTGLHRSESSLTRFDAKREMVFSFEPSSSRTAACLAGYLAGWSFFLVGDHPVPFLEPHDVPRSGGSSLVCLLRQYRGKESNTVIVRCRQRVMESMVLLCNTTIMVMMSMRMMIRVFIITLFRSEK